MADDSRPRLGRGLAALIGDFDDETAAIERAKGPKRVPVEFLRPNPRNPRKRFDAEALQDLGNSIRERGIIQPILVRVIPGVADAYEIVAGERRWRAAQLAGIDQITIVIVEAGDRETLEIAIIENVQRSDLTPIEEAYGYEQLSNEFGYTQADLARVIGKSRSHVANTLRLLKLSESTRDLLSNGQLTAGHARALISLDDPDAAARRIVDQGLAVRDAEKIARREAEGKDRPGETTPATVSRKNADTLALETTLSDVLGLAVSINDRAGRGELVIRYKTLEQLEALCHRLRG